MNLTDKEFFSMRDIAQLLGVSHSHVKQNLRWELPKPIRVGKRCLRWSRAQVDAYIKNQTGK